MSKKKKKTFLITSYEPFSTYIIFGQQIFIFTLVIFLIAQSHRFMLKIYPKLLSIVTLREVIINNRKK